MKTAEYNAEKFLLTLKRELVPLMKANRQHFDMEEYVYVDDEDVAPTEKLECGTTLCAMGFFPLVPTLKEHGWVYNKILSSWYPDLVEQNGDDALSNVYDLDDDEIKALFYNFDITTPEEWEYVLDMVMENRGMNI